MLVCSGNTETHAQQLMFFKLEVHSFIQKTKEKQTKKNKKQSKIRNKYKQKTPKNLITLT